MARKKILHVLEANIGGARKHVYQILGGLESERYDLHLACSFERDPAADSEADVLRSLGVTVHPVPMRRQPSARADAKALRKLRQLMRREGYDLVHTHASKAGYLGRRAAHLAKVGAILHTPHTFPFERVDTHLRFLYRHLERRAARWADRIVLVAPSQGETALRARLCPESKLAVVENGIAVPDTAPGQLRAGARKLLGLDEGTPALAFVGRVTPQKDVQTFLHVAAQVLEHRPDTHIFLVGQADQFRYLRSLRPKLGKGVWRTVARSVVPEGPVFWSKDLPVRVLGHRDDAAELVAAFDAVILPSLYEGLPYSLLEAMVCGVPVVASMVTGNQDVIHHGRNGLLVPPRDVAGFVEGCMRLLTEDTCRAQLGAAARRTVLEQYTEGHFLDGIRRLYDEVLGTD